MDKKFTARCLLLITIIIIAAFLRLYNIAGLPPGLYPDEAMNGNNALEALSTGNFKVFYPENNGREGLFINIQALFLAIFGNEPWALRLPSVIFGILTVLGIYFLAKELFREKNSKPETLNSKQIQNPNFQNSKNFRILDLGFRISHSEKIALLSSFFLATSFWHINFSRIGFRAIMAPTFLVWGIFLLLKALNQIKNNSQFLISNIQSNSKFQIPKSKFHWLLPLLAGAVYGLGFYSYIAYRATPLLIFVILLFYWISILRTSDVHNHNRMSDVRKLIRRKFLLSIFYFLISTIIVVAPLGLYFLQNPQDFFGRTTQISIFNSPTLLKNLSINILKTAGMFNFIGDWNWRHNYAGRPELFWPVGILFLIGIFLIVKSLIQKSKIKNQNDPEQIASQLYGAGNSKFKADTKTLHFAFCILISWLIVAALPAVVSNEGIPHALRSLLMIPPVFILAGVGGIWFYGFIKSKVLTTSGIKLQKFFLLSIFCFLLSLFIFEAYTAYFIKWGQNPSVYGAFSADYVKIGRELRDLPKELPKYVVIEAPGADVRGIPMPAQTVMFITGTFTPEKQKEKNIYYILPSQINQIPEDSYLITLK